MKWKTVSQAGSLTRRPRRGESVVVNVIKAETTEGNKMSKSVGGKQPGMGAFCWRLVSDRLGKVKG